LQEKPCFAPGGIALNGYVLAMVGHLKSVSPTFAQMFNSSTNAEFITVSPTIANTMLVAVFLFVEYRIYFV
jgi:hypothetical protein